MAAHFRSSKARVSCCIPCLAAALGAVHSSGEDSALYRGASKSKFWAAGGPVIRARQLFSELALEVYAGPSIPFAGYQHVRVQRARGRSVFPPSPVGRRPGRRELGVPATLSVSF